jgi:hypothetical protein
MSTTVVQCVLARKTCSHVHNIVCERLICSRLYRDTVDMHTIRQDSSVLASKTLVRSESLRRESCDIFPLALYALEQG